MNLNKEAIDELSEIDLANALGVHKAGQSGAFGVEIDHSSAGTLGAAMTDTQRISAEYLEGKINRDEARHELKNVAVNTFRVYVERAADIVLTPVAEFLKTKMPILSKVIDAGKEFVKQKVFGFVADVAVKAFSWIKEKLFSWG